MYNSLDKKSIKVMRINALISGVFILLVLALILYFVWPEVGRFSHIILIIASAFIIINVLLNVILYPRIRYNRYKYLITNEKIEVKEGLFFITRTIILIKKVQKIEINDGPIDRKFNLSNVNIFTAAGMTQIKFLDKNEAENITNQINSLILKQMEKKNEN